MGHSSNCTNQGALPTAGRVEPRKVSKKAGRALYRRRQQLIEPVFGQIKDVRGIRRFTRRGKAACDSELKLICGTHNLLKLYRRARLDPSVAPFSRMAVGTTS